LIEINAGVADPGEAPAMDRFSAAEDGPQYELIALARTMNDLTPAEATVPEPTGLTPELIWAAITLLVMLAFVGWLLVG
jgi:hypothetical protein